MEECSLDLIFGPFGGGADLFSNSLNYFFPNKVKAFTKFFLIIKSLFFGSGGHNFVW